MVSRLTELFVVGPGPGFYVGRPWRIAITIPQGRRAVTRGGAPFVGDFSSACRGALGRPRLEVLTNLRTSSTAWASTLTKHLPPMPLPVGALCCRRSPNLHRHNRLSFQAAFWPCDLQPRTKEQKTSLSNRASRLRKNEVQNACVNCAEITRALSVDEIRRELFPWGIFTTGGLLACKNGASPLASGAFAEVPSATFTMPEILPEGDPSLPAGCSCVAS